MGNELVPSTVAGAVVPATGGAVGEHIGDLSRDSRSSAELAAELEALQADWTPQQREFFKMRSEIRRDLIADGIGQEQLYKCLAIMRDYSAVLEAALNAGNTELQIRIGREVDDELLKKGLLTPEQLERAKAILQRYEERAERAILGAGAQDSRLVDELRELNALMEDRRSAYWKGPDAERLQARWRELHDIGVRANQQRHTPDVDMEARITQIEKWMSSRPGSEDYKRYWKDPAIQGEYLTLISRRQS